MASLDLVGWNGNVGEDIELDLVGLGGEEVGLEELEILPNHLPRTCAWVGVEGLAQGSGCGLCENTEGSFATRNQNG